MANMILDSHTFLDNPETATPVRAEKRCSSVLTFDDVAFFNWGVTIKGKEIDLKWRYMDLTEFESLDTIYQKAGPVVFNPQVTGGATYNVQVKSLEGDLFRKTTGTGAFRVNVSMRLLIMSVVP